MTIFITLKLIEFSKNSSNLAHSKKTHIACWSKDFVKCKVHQHTKLIPLWFKFLYEFNHVESLILNKNTKQEFLPTLNVLILFYSIENKKSKPRNDTFHIHSCLPVHIKKPTSKRNEMGNNNIPQSVNYESAFLKRHSTTMFPYVIRTHTQKMYNDILERIYNKLVRYSAKNIS